MPATYPVGLTYQYALRDAVSMAPQSITVRSSVDQGRPRHRRRFTQPVLTFQVAVYLVDSTELTTFHDFWRDSAEAGATTFEWYHPITGATINCRFIPGAEPQYSPLGSGFRASFAIEVLP